MSTYWGYHLMLDCAACDHDKITDGANITAFTKELVKRIDMVAYGEPVVAHFATHDLSKSGISFCQMIETSNITGHFVDADGNFYIDVFSCKPYSIDVVVDTFREYFDPTSIRQNFLTRQA